MRRKTLVLSSLLALAGLATGCSLSGDAALGEGSPTGTGSVGVGQGGAQDIGELRAIVSEGQVPAPDTLEPLGFFAEHALDLPPADCGERVCVQPSLAVAPRFDGSNWTMAFVALNSAVDPASEPRPDAHIVIAIEATDRTQAELAMLSSAVRELVIPLRAADRVSVIEIGDRAEVHGASLLPTDPALGAAIAEVATSITSTRAATYDGLALAARTLDGWTGARRVVLLTSGRADAGVTDESRVLALADALGRDGVSLSVVGLGDSYEARLPSAIGDLGTGTYSFAESPAALVEILRIEGRTALVPLARDFQMQLTASPGYRIGRVYGARTVIADATTATLRSPMLVLGQREGSSDVEHGRRGGGGGIFVELIADPSLGIAAGAPAFLVDATFVDPSTGVLRTLQREVVNALAPGQNPDDMWPSFSDPERGKPFMMLNMYLALRGVLDFYDAGDCSRAIGVVDMMQLSVDGWQGRFDDPDIDADNHLLLDVRANVASQCESSEPVAPVQPRGFEGGCMMI